MEKLKNILIPVDFSECAMNAIDYALGISQNQETEITLVHAYYVPFSFSETGTAVDGRTLECLKNNAEEEMENLKDRYKDFHSSMIFKCVASFGIDAIKNELEHKSYDLIVMGTKGASGLGELFLGSITANVIQEVEVPIICVPNKSKFTKIKNIAFACDYEDMYEPKEINFLKQFAKMNEATVHVVNVKEKTSSGHFNEAPYLESLFHDVPHTHSTSRFENLEAGLNDFITENDIDMLAMMPRKKNIFQKLFSESHTSKMAYHTKIPLLAVHE